jgi:hypothetical protein
MVAPFSIVRAYATFYEPRGYRAATAKLLGSDLCYKDKDVGLSFCFPTDGTLTVDHTSPSFKNSVRANSQLGVMGLNEGPVRINLLETDVMVKEPLERVKQYHDEKKANLRWILDLEKPVPWWKDGHRKITELALKKMEASHPNTRETIAFFDHDPNAVETLSLENAYRDHAPTPHATLADFILRLFNPKLGPHHHGLAGVKRDSKNVPARLQTVAETRAKVREGMQQYLLRANLMQRELQKDRPVLENEDSINRYIRDVEKIVETFNKAQEFHQKQKNKSPSLFERLYSVMPWSKKEESPKNEELRAVVQWIKGRRHLYEYPKMRNLYFPNNDSNEYDNVEVVRVLLQTYIDLATSLRNARDCFKLADIYEKQGKTKMAKRAFTEGTFHHRNFLRYIVRDEWKNYGGGRGPLTARGQIEIASAIHMGQDATGAHCRDMRENVCHQYVSTNHYGIPPIHKHADDKLNDKRGHWKASNQVAAQLTQDILEYAQIKDAQKAHTRLNEILDRYFPTS